MLSPWVDVTLVGASMQAMSAVDLVLAQSPLFADLRGIAPRLIQVGSPEVLLDDATRLAATAAAADVAVQLDVTPDDSCAGVGPRVARSPGSGDARSPGGLAEST